jgi:hypothetical protein
MVKTKESAFEQGKVVGAKRTGISQELQHRWVFPRSTVSHVYQEWSTTQRTSSQLDTTVGRIGASIPVEQGYLVEFMPQQIEAVLRAKGVQRNIRKVFLIFCILRVYLNNFAFKNMTTI